MNNHEHAIVIGGSIAGLLTARVLADHFNRVTIVERDQLPRSADERAGTPQGKHVHNLLTRGLRILETLLPGFEKEMIDAGAIHVNWGKDIRTLTSVGWVASYETDLYSTAASRSLVEWTIRKRMLVYPGVTFIENTQVQQLLADQDRKQITGLRLKERGASGHEYELTADFVVDASGRSSKASEWLVALGYNKPEETTVDPLVGYATRLYRKPENFDKDWHILYMPAKASNTRGAGLFEIEGGLWMASLGGYSGDYPPTDHEGFMEYAKTLQEPDFYDAIKDAEPISDIIGYRRTLNIMRHYERLERFPEHFALVGDAVCGFNPIYGQGMTSAAMGAVLLGETLKAAKGQLMGLGKTFQQRLAKQNQTMWLMSTAEDFRQPATIGKRPGWSTKLVQTYIDWVIDLTPYDKYAINAFVLVMNLNAPPTSLFQPRILAAVLRHRLFGPPKQAAAQVELRSASAQ
jgi:flavin-dependent dehydrogenase